MQEAGRVVPVAFTLVAGAAHRGRRRGDGRRSAARRCLGVSTPPTRRVFTARTLDFEDIQVIGYDLDYTLIHYRVEAWEGAVYEESKRILRKKGFNVEELQFDPNLVSRGLVIDKKLGNIVKVDSFGYIRRAMHGTQMITKEELGSLYGQTVRVDLREDRWEFLNTLFSTASACLFCQLIECAYALDQDVCVGDTVEAFGDSVAQAACDSLFDSPAELFEVVSRVVSETHVAGVLKERIQADPSTYVQLDGEAAHALLDQKLAGRRLVLITNNDLVYTNKMMSYTYDRFLPDGLTWRSLFDLVIVNALKPNFWTLRLPCWRVVDEERAVSFSTPALCMQVGNVYCGGNARLVEDCFGCYGEDVMYVGDHIYSDTNVAKSFLRWRTCLVMRELEAEVRGLALSQKRRQQLQELLLKQDELRQRRGQMLAQAARRSAGILSWPREKSSSVLGVDSVTEGDLAPLEDELIALSNRLADLDGDVAKGPGVSFRWGFLTRVGMHGKSHLMRQVEKYADIYTSRVSNFLAYTPHARFRAPLQSDRIFLQWGEEDMADLGAAEEAFAIQRPGVECSEWRLQSPEMILEHLQTISTNEARGPERNGEFRSPLT